MKQSDSHAKIDRYRKGNNDWLTLGYKLVVTTAVSLLRTY